jgi:acetyl esterase/lipase
MKPNWLVFFLLLALAACSPAPKFDETRLGTVDRDIRYCEMDGTGVLMDIYYPPKNNGPWPVLLHVHGGGWSSGSKDNSYIFPDFTEPGILGVEVGYRLAPGAQFPAQIDDVKCAVRYLRAHAAEYNLDPDRILAVGESAGGHLVALLGATADSGEFNEAGQWLEYSSDVRAVAAISAPTNLDTISCWSDYTAQLAQGVFGGSTECNTNDPKLVNASPAAYVTEGDPPILLISGTADSVVPYEQAVTFHEQLLAAGVDSRLVLIEGGDHGLQVPGNPAATDEAWQALIDFIIEQLKIKVPFWM